MWKVKGLGGTGDGRVGSYNTGESGGASAKTYVKPLARLLFVCFKLLVVGNCDRRAAL